MNVKYFSSMNVIRSVIIVPLEGLMGTKNYGLSIKCMSKPPARNKLGGAINFSCLRCRRWNFIAQACLRWILAFAGCSKIYSYNYFGRFNLSFVVWFTELGPLFERSCTQTFGDRTRKV